MSESQVSPVIRKKMNPEVKAKWVEALRSGEFTQGKYALRSRWNGEVTFCCLGVLCEIAVKEEVVKKYNGDRGVLPRDVSSWAGIPRYSNKTPGSSNTVQGYLANHNDGVPYHGINSLTFGEIADWIEENL